MEAAPEPQTPEPQEHADSVKKEVPLLDSCSQAGTLPLAPYICSLDPGVPVEPLVAWGLLGPHTLRPGPWCCLQINMTHYIRHLSFGEDYPGIVNPLDRTNVTAPQGTCLGGSPQLPKPCPAPMRSAVFSLQLP